LTITTVQASDEHKQIPPKNESSPIDSSLLGTKSSGETSVSSTSKSTTSDRSQNLLQHPKFEILVRNNLAKWLLRSQLLQGINQAIAKLCFFALNLKFP
jgi:hypothetical protein